MSGRACQYNIWIGMKNNLIIADENLDDDLYREYMNLYKKIGARLQENGIIDANGRYIKLAE